MSETLREKTYTVTEKADSQSGDHFQEIIDPPDLPPDWGLLIGDFAYNARAALDHLAWDLALLNHPGRDKAIREGAEWPPKHTEFPIYADVRKNRAKQRLKNKLSIFLPEHQGLIANEQPHTRGRDARTEPLWLLHELRNADAHRLIHTMLVKIPISDRLHDVEVSDKGKVSVWIGDVPHRFEELTIFSGDRVETTLKIKGDFTPLVTLDQRGADFHGQEVLPLLHRCRDEVERIFGLF